MLYQNVQSLNISLFVVFFIKRWKQYTTKYRIEIIKKKNLQNITQNCICLECEIKLSNCILLNYFLLYFLFCFRNHWGIKDRSESITAFDRSFHFSSTLYMSFDCDLLCIKKLDNYLTRTQRKDKMNVWMRQYDASDYHIEF